MTSAADVAHLLLLCCTISRVHDVVLQRCYDRELMENQSSDFTVCFQASVVNLIMDAAAEEGLTCLTWLDFIFIFLKEAQLQLTGKLKLNFSGCVLILPALLD